MKTYFNNNGQRVNKEEYIEVLQQDILTAQSKLDSKNINYAKGTIQNYEYVIENSKQRIEQLKGEK